MLGCVYCVLPVYAMVEVAIVEVANIYIYIYIYIIVK